MTVVPAHHSHETRLCEHTSARVHPILLPDNNLLACNPSIAADGSGFRAIVRTVNYKLDEAGRCHPPPGGRYMSENWLTEFDRELQVTRSRRIDDSRFCADDGPFPGGFEDCRLFLWNGAWWFSATVVTEFAGLMCGIVLCRLDDAQVAECRSVASPTGAEREKNWMPVVDRTGLGWIYRIDPAEVARYRDDAPPVLERAAPLDLLDGWSGSSQCVRFRRRWLCVVHVRRDRGDGIFYEHCFVELTDGFRIRRISDPWLFERSVVEFCAGLCVAGDDLVLSYGVLDQHARLIRIPGAMVEDMLRPVALSRRIAAATRTSWGRLRDTIAPSWRHA